MRGRCERVLDPAVALHDIVPELAENQVVFLATRQIVVAEAADAGLALVEGEGVQLGIVDRVLGPPRRAVRVAVIARNPVDQKYPAVLAGDIIDHEPIRDITVRAAVQQITRQCLETPALDVVGDITVGTAHAGQRGDVVAKHQVVGLVAVKHVVTGATDDDVAAEMAEHHVVVTALVVTRFDGEDRVEGRGLDLLQQRVRQVRVGHVLDHGTVVAEDHVVVSPFGRVTRRHHRVRPVAVDQVAAGKEHRVAHWRGVGLDRRAVVEEVDQVNVDRWRRAGVHRVDRQRPVKDVDVDARVAVDVVDAAVAVDLVVA